MSETKRPKVLLIEWVDSASDGGWKCSEELTVNLAYCETKEAVVLALNRGVKDGFRPFGDLISIPKVCITKRKVLKI